MKTPDNASAVLCNPYALALDQRMKHMEDTLKLLHKVSKVLELPSGLTLQFPNERATLVLAAEFAADEAQCCPFLDFEIRMQPQERILELTMTGPEGSREFLKAELNELLPDEQ